MSTHKAPRLVSGVTLEKSLSPTLDKSKPYFLYLYNEGDTSPPPARTRQRNPWGDSVIYYYVKVLNFIWEHDGAQPSFLSI